MGFKKDTFNYVHSCDIKTNVFIKIGTLEGKRPRATYRELLENPVLQFTNRNKDCSDLIIECRLYADGRYITLPITTSYKAFTTRWNWNEWLEFPVRFCDLPRNVTLLMTIYDYEGPQKKVVVGGTSVPLFEDGVFLRGMRDLRVWPGVAGDPLKTPGKGPLENEENDQMYRLNKLVKKHESGQMPRVDWLDRLVFREIEVINDREKRSTNFVYLMVEFPRAESKGIYHHIIWWENACKPDNYRLNKFFSNMKIYDPELGLENLQESKHHHLTRSLQSGITDRDLKPNSINRDLLFNIIQYPPTRQLTSDEQDLVWKYRFFLSNLKKGLPKFLKCVNWNLEKEAKQALALLNEWSPPDAHDALELLGPDFTQPKVRRYAVERLSNASDDELLLYLLQLVQALKYEAWEVKDMNLLDVSHYSLSSDASTEPGNGNLNENLPRKDSLVSCQSRKDSLVTCQSRKDSLVTCQGTNESNFDNYFMAKDKEESSGQLNPLQPHTPTRESREQPTPLLEGSPFDNCSHDLVSFLIRRSCENGVLANYLYWYLLIECEVKSPYQELKPESKIREMYLWVMTSFKVALQQWSPTSKATWHTLTRQQHFVDSLVSLVNILNKESSGRLKKIEKLQSLLSDPELKLNNFEPLPLPLNPEVIVCGIIPGKATLFKSALEPCRLTFRTVDESEYITIFKCGDDLRQDQLIIQIITLMDKLLLNENMDLKLTPYRVLATSSRDGFVQYIDSVSVAEVLRTDGSIQNFFRANAPCESAAYGISPQVMDTYVKSCAGYCVITYLLGIGDRHFDNLLLTREGHLFHIDFGYILGRDPKPLPPPMKLTKEMVEAMGGQSSDHYNEFRKLCYTTFMQLRRHSSLVLNLFTLMVDASVPDIALEPDKTTKKVEDRFCLSLSEEESVAHFQEVIDNSVGAVVAVVVEHFHRLAQYMRK